MLTNLFKIFVGTVFCFSILNAEISVENAKTLEQSSKDILLLQSTIKELQKNQKSICPVMTKVYIETLLQQQEIIFGLLKKENLDNSQIEEIYQTIMLANKIADFLNIEFNKLLTEKDQINFNCESSLYEIGHRINEISNNTRREFLIKKYDILKYNIDSPEYIASKYSNLHRNGQFSEMLKYENNDIKNEVAKNIIESIIKLINMNKLEIPHELFGKNISIPQLKTFSTDEILKKYIEVYWKDKSFFTVCDHMIIADVKKKDNNVAVTTLGSGYIDENKDIKMQAEDIVILEQSNEKWYVVDLTKKELFGVWKTISIEINDEFTTKLYNEDGTTENKLNELLKMLPTE